MHSITKFALCGVLLALLTGCATTYKDILENGYKYSSESTRKPPEVAECIIQRVHSQRPWRAMRRPFGERGAIEVVISSGGEGVAAIAHVTPSPYGSIVDTWLTKRAVITRDIWHEEFFGGC
jgi:hypothetical protein